MTTTVEAVYQDGVLKPDSALPLPDGARVEIVVRSADLSEPVPDPREAARIMAEIAALPEEGDQTPFSGRDHDKILYGEKGAW